MEEGLLEEGRDASRTEEWTLSEEGFQSEEGVISGKTIKCRRMVDEARGRNEMEE